MSTNYTITPGVALAETEKFLGEHSATIVSIVWSESLLEYTCRLRCRRTRGLAFGSGRTLAAAIQDAFDEFIVELRPSRGPGRPPVLECGVRCPEGEEEP